MRDYTMDGPSDIILPLDDTARNLHIHLNVNNNINNSNTNINKNGYRAYRRPRLVVHESPLFWLLFALCWFLLIAAVVFLFMIEASIGFIFLSVLFLIAGIVCLVWMLRLHHQAVKLAKQEQWNL